MLAYEKGSSSRQSNEKTSISWGCVPDSCAGDKPVTSKLWNPEKSFCYMQKKVLLYDVWPNGAGLPRCAAAGLSLFAKPLFGHWKKALEEPGRNQEEVFIIFLQICFRAAMLASLVYGWYAKQAGMNVTTTWLTWCSGNIFGANHNCSGKDILISARHGYGWPV